MHKVIQVKQKVRHTVRRSNKDSGHFSRCVFSEMPNPSGTSHEDSLTAWEWVLGAAGAKHNPLLSSLILKVGMALPCIAEETDDDMLSSSLASGSIVPASMMRAGDTVI